MTVAQLLAKMFTEIFQGPFRNWAMVEIASNRCSRAAMAPPIMPMTSEKCSTNSASPWIPVLKKPRKILSASGRKMSAKRQITSSPFSRP